MDTFSIGFIGGSLQSAVGYTHFISSRMDNRWSVDAGCFSTDADANQATSQAYGINPDKVYDTWQKMLANEKQLDAILILTPTPSHYEIVTACLNKGFSVICEKALALNSTEAKKIITVQKLNKGFLAVTYNYSGYPIVRELRQKINNGVLGKILHFQAEMPQEGFIKADVHGNKITPQSWRLTDTGVIPTIYLDLAVHLHQLIYYLIGQKPIEVVSQQASNGWFEVIDNVMCLVRYTDNIQGQFWFSKSALGHRNGLKLRIYGSKASAEWYQNNPEELLLSYSDGKREIVDRASSCVELANNIKYNRFKAGHPAGFMEAFANLYIDIADSLRQYKTTGIWKSEEVYGPTLALDGLHFLEAISKSAKSKVWQKVID
ncbi:Gfo/Idh/MocA family oxidoreductase [Candidatus Halobeggiatoa sp. HSG11]|nr:Gfo/Idh/MocA family oxidoreductase [Candidatus Halobeggiatoa sp. HSG11]